MAINITFFPLPKKDSNQYLNLIYTGLLLTPLGTLLLDLADFRMLIGKKILSGALYCDTHHHTCSGCHQEPLLSIPKQTSLAFLAKLLATGHFFIKVLAQSIWAFTGLRNPSVLATLRALSWCWLALWYSCLVLPAYYWWLFLADYCYLSYSCSVSSSVCVCACFHVCESESKREQESESMRMCACIQCWYNSLGYISCCQLFLVWKCCHVFHFDLTIPELHSSVQQATFPAALGI